MKTLANYIKEYPSDVHPFKKLDDIEKYAEFMESKPIYDPKHEFWKDFEVYDQSKGDGWIRLRYKNIKRSVWWFPKLQELQMQDGNLLKSYEEIARYILRT